MTNKTQLHNLDAHAYATALLCPACDLAPQTYPAEIIIIIMPSCP